MTVRDAQLIELFLEDQQTLGRINPPSIFAGIT